MQGPYRTTPSRDNVPRGDSWNQYLVHATATLLVEALRWLRDGDMLDTAALRCLPLDRVWFGEGNMFSPLFEATRCALASEPLLPSYAGNHVPASKARLARTQELRVLFGSSQLASLFGHPGDLVWLTGEVTQDRTADLSLYMMRELNIPEVTPETILPNLDQAFLQAQSDSWVLDLYGFLNGQPALRRRLDDLPLIRLEDGTHVTARSNGQPQAFLPSAIVTNFPTVRQAVCATDEAREFLKSLGLTEPDPVDDVVWNVLPKYRSDEVDVDDATYEADLRRVLTAFATDSKTQREKLLAALRDTAFLMAVDASDGSTWVSKPGEVYLATERMKDLFAGVPDVLLVDDAYTCLRGEDVRDLLEACGATRYLQPVVVAATFTWQQLRDMRIAAGCESASSAESPKDYSLRGLDKLLGVLPELDVPTRASKARLLWEALGDVQERRGTGTFSGTYRWTYYHAKTTTFDAAFVRELNAVSWVPNQSGALQQPEFVVFDSLGWKPNPFLLAKIRFKPPIIETLAKEAGIESGVLDLLKKLGVTTEAELRSKLGISDEPPDEPTGEPGPATVEDALKNLLGNAPAPTPPVPDPAAADQTTTGAGSHASGGTAGGAGSAGGRGSSSDSSGDRSGRGAGHKGAGAGSRTPGGAGTKPFISYVATHPDDDGPDPDGIDQTARMALEEKAIVVILGAEPRLQRTPSHNPGFDLFEAGDNGDPERWIEVKAMTAGLQDRPVGLSHTQFECAREHGEAYWLYVVEHAGDEHARIVRIQDPARRAKTFTFDHGWLSVAEAEEPSTRTPEGPEGDAAL